MIRTFYPGGSYGYAFPTGEQCILFSDHVQTHTGTEPLPPLGVLYLVASKIPAFKFAGQALNTAPGQALNYEWTPEAGWTPKPAVYQGVSPCVYDLQGTLHMNDGSAGSQGYRCVVADGTPAGRVVTSDETYGPWHNLSQWMPLGEDLYIGQAQPDDANNAAWIFDARDGSHRLLEPGPCFFIRREVEGQNAALVLVAPGGTWVIRATFADLRALPLVTNAPPPVPVPVPVPHPTPEPDPMSLIAPNQIDTVHRVMREHPEINTNSEETREGILDYIVHALGHGPWGRKSRNREGTNLNTDAITFKRPDGLFEIYDVISGGDGSATWDGFGPFRDGENGYWVPARPVTSAPAPPPTPAPAPGLPGLDEAAVRRIVRDEINGLRIALRVQNGDYLCAEGGGGGAVVADRPDAGPWETLIVKVQK